ncbi:MAG: tetratricopeptide repeat protein [Candidatus Latescibacterota bacterium]
MKSTLTLLALALAAAAAGLALPAVAEEAAAPQDTSRAAVQGGDEDWLNTVWTQVDDLTKQEEYKLQETVTVAGVRGAEAEDNILDKLYYKGGVRYPSQDKLHKAIETLKQSLKRNPKSADAPKTKYFVAQCYEKLDQTEQARTYYAMVAKDHPESPWAARSQERLQQLAPAQSQQ